MDLDYVDTLFKKKKSHKNVNRYDNIYRKCNTKRICL